MPKQNSTYKKQLGNQGEDIAATFLTNKGYSIIKRNFKLGKSGEIDIIAQSNNIIIFVEVKTRTNYKFGNPLEQISLRKRNNWKKTAEEFMFNNNILNQECRLDLITIDMEGKEHKITHIENAF